MRLTLFLVALGLIALIVPGESWRRILRRIRIPSPRIRIPPPRKWRIPPPRKWRIPLPSTCGLIGKKNTRAVHDDFKDSLMEGFKILDRNNDQLIGGEEFENFSKVFPNLGMPAKELFSKFDTNEDGAIAFDELATGFIKQIDNGYARKDDQPDF